MAADLATLGIRIDASQAMAEAGRLEGALGKVKGVAAALGVTLGAGLLLRKFVTETSEAQAAVAQLEARLKSTGGIAGQSSAQLQAFASEMQRLTTYSDEAVLSAQTMLLTFTHIRGETFPAATKAVLNLATAMGTDAKGAAIQLGKALQDPAQGLLALRRSGVSFSEEQQKVIKVLFETGRQAEAQQMILAELEVEFGGAAEAARETFGGALAHLKNVWGELFEVSRKDSAGVVGAMNALAAALPYVRNAFDDFFRGWANLAQVAAIRVQQAFSDVKGFFGGLVGVLGQFTHDPKLAAWGSAMVAQNTALQASLKTLEADVLAASAAFGKEADAAKIVTTANGVLTESTVQLAVAEEREARAKARITAEAKALVDLEERQARTRGLLAGGRLPTRTPMAGTGLDINVWGTATAGLGSLADYNAALAARNAAFTQFLLLQNGAAADALREQVEHEQAIRKTMLKDLQRSFSALFEDILTRGTDAFDALWESVKRGLFRMVGDIVASKVMEKLTPKLESTTTSAAASIPGAAPVVAAAAALPGGWVGKAFGGIAGLFKAHHDAGEAAKEQAKREEELAIAHRKAAEAAAAEQAFTEMLARSDLRVRALRAQGMGAEADALALWNNQVKEFAAAVRAGFSPEFLAELGRVQEWERQKQAADAAAEATNRAIEAQQKWAEQLTKWAEEVSAAQARAAEYMARMADATEDLGVRLLRAQGQTEEADRRAFAAQQARELRAAQSEQRALGLEMMQLQAERVALIGHGTQAQADMLTQKYGALLQMLDAAFAYTTELAKVQLVEAGAFGRGQSMPGATAAQPGTAGSFGTIVSRTTAYQGDRMVDELTTSRILLALIEENTRPLRQFGTTVDRAGGSALQGSLAFAGSSVVS